MHYSSREISISELPINCKTRSISTKSRQKN